MSVANAESIEVEVEVEVEGKTYQATYMPGKGVVIIKYEGAEVSTQVGNITPDRAASHLLSELVQDKRIRY